MSQNLLLNTKNKVIGNNSTINYLIYDFTQSRAFLVALVNTIVVIYFENNLQVIIRTVMEDKPLPALIVLTLKAP